MKHLSADSLFDVLTHHPHAKVLDVRFTRETAASHPPVVHHVPWFNHNWEPNPDFMDRVLDHLSPDDHVLVICHNGEFSCQASALLEKSGFRHVYNVLGGYEGLKAGMHPHWSDVPFCGI